MKKSLAVALLAVLAAAGVGYLAGQSQVPMSSPAAPDGAADPERAQDATPATVGADTTAGVVVSARPLPPVGTPLAQIDAELRSRAAAGEAGAACRLASEHERCEMQRVHLRALTLQSDQLTTNIEAFRGPAEARERIVRSRERLAAPIRDTREAVALCDAVPALGPAGRARYWRQAALAGHVPAMRHYAIGNAFRWHDLLEAIPALQTYRQEAEELARRAATEGDAASAYALAMAYADSDGGHWRPFLAQVVTPDLTRALAWFSVLERHPEVTRLPADHPTARSVAHHLATLRAAATPVEIARATRLSQAVVTPSASTLPDTTTLRPDGGAGDIGPKDCDEAPSRSARTAS
ncbi:hypothetical protein [Luteimonas terrae]|uniref:Uncharacterized protein n=1 Tax=Luteimonas terrae TaxID=1530191 RepID=A0A4R5U949_9GAMM|nr:hypothetical protein [Luteimonas terrae]TDK31015.1 hypothetical protein E2F49_11835 [Luteimonas terrae]